MINILNSIVKVMKRKNF